MSSIEKNEQNEKNDYFYLRVAYFASIACTSILVGFSFTVNKLRKSTPENTDAVLYEEGAALARKALMRGTIYSVIGFGCFAVASYNLFGKHWIREFNARTKRSDAQDIKYLQGILGTRLTDEAEETSASSSATSSQKENDR